MSESPLTMLREELRTLCNDAGAFRKYLDHLSPEEVLEAQVYVWDFLMQLAAEKGVVMSRTDVTKRMIPTSTWQYSVGCNERMDYCRANICLYTNPTCAANKLKSQMEALRRIISELLKKV
jgi:hypothetical protein